MTYHADAKPEGPSASYRKARARPARASRRAYPAAAVVYFIQAETLRLVKIGLTMDLNDRLKTLQVGSPDKLTLIGAIYDPNAASSRRSVGVKSAARAARRMLTMTLKAEPPAMKQMREGEG